jgi:hypothetical protein
VNEAPPGVDFITQFKLMLSIFLTFKLLEFWHVTIFLGVLFDKIWSNYWFHKNSSLGKLHVSFMKLTQPYMTQYQFYKNYFWRINPIKDLLGGQVICHFWSKVKQVFPFNLLTMFYHLSHIWVSLNPNFSHNKYYFNVLYLRHLFG